MVRSRVPILAALTASVFSVIFAGCSNDSSGIAPAGSPSTVFGIALNQHAINMSLAAPFNAMQLTVSALDSKGRTLADTAHVIFSSTDSSVSVVPSGVITARYVTPSGGARIVATVHSQNITYADTAFVRISATTPVSPIATFSIQPGVGDSAFRTIDDIGYTPTVQATDRAGNPITFSSFIDTVDFFWLASSDVDVAVPSRPLYNNYNAQFLLQKTGYVTLYATAWVYGATVQDSLRFFVGWPNMVNAFDDDTPCLWSKCTIFLSTGGSVNWYTSSPGPFDIIFDDSLAVDSARETVSGTPGGGPYTGRGNVHFPDNPNGTFEIRARRFPTAGSYRYHSALDPAKTGVIYVLDNPK